MEIADVIAKIEKLRALSQSKNQHEAETAFAKMNALIDKYRITVDQLGTKPDDPIGWGLLYGADRIMYWRMRLALDLAKHYGCFILGLKNVPGANAQTFMVAGRQSDVGVLRYMFAFISSECERISVKVCKGKGRQYAESYRLGFVVGVLAKLGESRAEAAEGDSSAIVKLDSRASEAESFVRKAAPESIEKPRTYRPDVQAYGRGVQAGTELHLGASLEASGPLALEA